MARIVRGQVLTLKQQEFVKAAIVTGADTKRIIVKHLIPNMMGPIMVNMAMQIPSAIFNEAFLSFVGLGISAPMISPLSNPKLTSRIASTSPKCVKKEVCKFFTSNNFSLICFFLLIYAVLERCRRSVMSVLD